MLKISQRFSYLKCRKFTLSLELFQVIPKAGSAGVPACNVLMARSGHDAIKPPLNNL
jgi:hypothetical protein